MSRVSLSQLQNASRSIEALRELFPDPNAAKPAALPVPLPFDASILAVNQQAALIHLTESHIKRVIVGKLLEDSQDFLHDGDFAPLRDLGLAEKPEGYRLNKLTPQGNIAAKLLTAKLCIELNLHMLTEGGDSGWQVRYSCPCGFSTMVRRSGTARGNAGSQHAAHVRTNLTMNTLRAGLKPPTMIAEG